MSIHSEILEQPDRLAELLSGRRIQTEQIAAAIRQQDIRFIFLAARGTSDNAGRYANYLWGARNQLPMALATPSLFTYYQQPPKLQEPWLWASPNPVSLRMWSAFWRKACARDA